ncbi:MAG: 50S ribosomal protein L15 [Planctomycetota bacterium]
MMIHEITPQAGRYKQRKRIGRGPGSGKGKTAGRGHKGFGSRSGNSNPHNGGGSPLHVRFPKRGFSNADFRTVYAEVNLAGLDARFDDGTEVTPELLAKVGLIRNTKLPVKVLGRGELSKKLTVTAAKFSVSAKAKIEAAGGTANEAK